ncbi:hypothetical protein [Humibacter ginsengisoli]
MGEDIRLVMRGVVLPIVHIVLVIVRTANGDNPGAAIFLPLGVAITVGMYQLVGITALLAVLDRNDAKLSSGIGSARLGDLR